MSLEVYQRLAHSHDYKVDDHIVLDHDVREKGRFKVESTSGQEVRVFLERGKTLLVGECLKTECGKIIEVQGAEEDVVEAHCDDWEVFSKACYHLGNRHVKIQVGERWLRMKSDYVLEDMLRLLGLNVEKKVAIFIPESGAYAGGHHHHH
ncbi:MAG: urease accessory protein UreE [Cellvibrionaceae bacterium]